MQQDWHLAGSNAFSTDMTFIHLFSVMNPTTTIVIGMGYIRLSARRTKLRRRMWMRCLFRPRSVMGCRWKVNAFETERAQNDREGQRPGAAGFCLGEAAARWSHCCWHLGIFSGWQDMLLFIFLEIGICNVLRVCLDVVIYRLRLQCPAWPWIYSRQSWKLLLEVFDKKWTVSMNESMSGREKVPSTSHLSPHADLARTHLHYNDTYLLQTARQSFCTKRIP